MKEACKMKSKTVLASVLTICAAFFVYAQEENLIKHGDFENLPPANEAKLKQFRAKGIEINHDSAVLIPGWYSKKDKAPVITLINAKNADDAKSGQHALKVEAVSAHMYTETVSPGTYELSFFCKGKGRIYINTYLYGKANKHLGNANTGFAVVPSATWKKYTKTIKIGFDKENVQKVRLAFVFVNAAVTLDDISLIPVKK